MATDLQFCNPNGPSGIIAWLLKAEYVLTRVMLAHVNQRLMGQKKDENKNKE